MSISIQFGQKQKFDLQKCFAFLQRTRSGLGDLGSHPSYGSVQHSHATDSEMYLSSLSPELQTCISNGLLDSSISQTSQLSQDPYRPSQHFSFLLAPSQVFPVLVNGTSFLLVFQASHPRVILGSSLIHLNPNQHKVLFPLPEPLILSPLLSLHMQGYHMSLFAQDSPSFHPSSQCNYE